MAKVFGMGRNVTPQGSSLGVSDVTMRQEWYQAMRERVEQGLLDAIHGNQEQLDMARQERDRAAQEREQEEGRREFVAYIAGEEYVRVVRQQARARAPRRQSHPCMRTTLVTEYDMRFLFPGVVQGGVTSDGRKLIRACRGILARDGFDLDREIEVERDSTSRGYRFIQRIEIETAPQEVEAPPVADYSRQNALNNNDVFINSRNWAYAVGIDLGVSFSAAWPPAAPDPAARAHTGQGLAGRGYGVRGAYMNRREFLAALGVLMTGGGAVADAPISAGSTIETGDVEAFFSPKIIVVNHPFSGTFSRHHTVLPARSKGPLSWTARVTPWNWP